MAALLQSPAVKEVLKDQDSRKGLIAAICAGKVLEIQSKLLFLLLPIVIMCLKFKYDLIHISAGGSVFPCIQYVLAHLTNNDLTM